MPSAHVVDGSTRASFGWAVGCDDLDGGVIPGCAEADAIAMAWHTAGAPTVGPPTCTIVDAAHDEVVLSLSVNDSGGGLFDAGTLEAFSFAQVRFALDPGVVGGMRHGTSVGPCQLTFSDGESYVGACGSADPSAEQPCQISIDITWPLDQGEATFGNIVLFRMQCIDIPSTTSSNRRTFSGGGSLEDCPLTWYY